MKLRRLCFYRRLSVHGGGGGLGCLPQCMLGYTLRSRHPRSRQPPWSRHPPGADTPREQTPHQIRPSLGVDTPPLGADPPGTKYTPRTKYPLGLSTPPPRDTATAVDGTHPTGMHSCFIYLFAFTVKKFTAMCAISAVHGCTSSLSVLMCNLFSRTKASVGN